MSVSFTIESIPTGRFTLSAACGWDETDPFAGVVFEDHESALAALVAHREACTECSHYGCFTSAQWDIDDSFEVNLANTNARTVLAHLDIATPEDDLYGQMDAEDFLGRVLTALATLGTPMGADDSGVADVEDARPGHATMVYCGLPAGYFARTFDHLHALATEAVRLGRPVVWS